MDATMSDQPLGQSKQPPNGAKTTWSHDIKPPTGWDRESMPIIPIAFSAPEGSDYSTVPRCQRSALRSHRAQTRTGIPDRRPRSHEIFFTFVIFGLIGKVGLANTQRQFRRTTGYESSASDPDDVFPGLACPRPIQRRDGRVQQPLSELHPICRTSCAGWSGRS